MPMITAVPRLRTMSMAVFVVAPLPYASKAKSTPPSVISCTRRTASSWRAFTVCVAPKLVANSSADSFTSTAMMAPAPASLAP